MVQVYHFLQTMPRFLSLHKHYCVLSRAWRACLYPRSGKVGKFTKSAELFMTTVGFTVIASTEGRGIIHFTTKSTDLQHVRFNCSHDYLNIHLEIQISRVFFGKKWLKESVWGKKKSIGSLSAGNQNSPILIILRWEDQLIFTSLWFLLKPYPFQDCNFHKQQSLQNDLRATSSKTAQNYRAYFGLHSLDFSYKE